MNSKRYWGTALLLMLFLAFVFFLLWMLYVDTRMPEKPSARIAVIVYGENSDRWRSLDQGIAFACRELGLEKPTLLSARGGSSTQASLLRRELDNGAQGLLVAAEDGEAVADVLAEVGVPLVMMESGSGDLPCIGVDDAALGAELAERISTHNGNIAVLAEGLSRENVRRRYETFTARMAELGHADISILRRENPTVDLKTYLASSLALHSPPIDTLVVLDSNALEVAIDAAPAAMRPVSLCGVGCSDKVLSALDKGIASEVVFPNEYAVGYWATLTLAAEMELARDAGPVTIQYSIVDRETMFQPEYERLLFPILQ